MYSNLFPAMLPTISRSILPRKQVKTNKIHRNSAIYTNPDVFQLISRDATYTPSQSIPAQAGKTNKIHRNSTIYTNPDVFQLISRDATYYLS